MDLKKIALALLECGVEMMTTMMAVLFAIMMVCPLVAVVLVTMVCVVVDEWMAKREYINLHSDKNCEVKCLK